MSLCAQTVRRLFSCFSPLIGVSQIPFNRCSSATVPFSGSVCEHHHCFGHADSIPSGLVVFKVCLRRRKRREREGENINKKIEDEIEIETET